MKEADLYEPLIDGGDEEDWLLYRMKEAAGYNPFDLGGADAYGIAVGIEVKRSKEDPERAEIAPIPWKLFETRQRSWLNEYAHHRCLALIALHYDKSGEMRLYHLSGGPDDRPRRDYYVGSLYTHHKLYRGWKRLLIPRGKFGIPKRIKGE